MKLFSRLGRIRKFRMNLRAQILLLGTAGVAIIGAIYLVSVQFEERSQRRADEFTTLTTLTARVSESLLQGRELATQFLQKPDEKKIAAHTAVVELATQSLAEIERIAAALPDDDPLRQATSFRAAINNYMIRFSNVVAAQKVIGFNENDGLQGKLRTAVHTVETRLKEHDEPRLTVLMLMMRRHEKDFMLRGDEKYGDDLNTRVDEFNAELANSGLAEDARAEIKKLVEAYKMSFMGYVAGQSTLTDEATDLAQIYERMKPTIIGVRKAAEQRLQSVRADLATVQHYVFWSICLTVVAVAMGALMFGRWISTPLIRIAGSMDLLSRGDLDTPIQPIARGDEIGKISGALQVFHQKLLDNRRLEAEQGEAQALAEAERRTSRLQVADQFEQAVSQIVRAVSTASAEIEAASGSLTKTAETTQELSTTVAAAAGQSSANVQSAAAASEQMVSSVSEISRQVQTSLEVARAAVLQADETNARIAKLSQSADRISDVVKTISAVASQTNLLALNATIEAARAGEAGKGFAVVATEVKALASPTAHATEQISAQISEMQAATQHSVDAIKEIGSTISHISEISSSIALSVEQQGAATQEIALNVQQAAAGAAQVTGSIAEVNRGATETGSAAGQVHGAARELLGESNHLRDEVEKFLATVRAA